ncbi:MAG: TOBE domain-containing protein [Thermoplasmata archaeon]
MAVRRTQTARENVLTPVDLRLLAGIDRERNVVRACREAKISRDRGVYRIRRLERILAEKVVRTRPGQGRRGTSELTPAGERLLRRGRGAYTLGKSRSNDPLDASVFRGIWSRRGGPHVRLDEGGTFWVGFTASEGESVALAVDPEAVLVARRKIPTSARNAIAGRIREVRQVDAARHCLGIAVKGAPTISALVTPHSVHALKLAPGVLVYLYIKATALRRLS